MKYKVETNVKCSTTSIFNDKNKNMFTVISRHDQKTIYMMKKNVFD